MFALHELQQQSKANRLLQETICPKELSIWGLGRAYGIITKY
jgi:hypothetical protein